MTAPLEWRCTCDGDGEDPLKWVDWDPRCPLHGESVRLVRETAEKATEHRRLAHGGAPCPEGCPEVEAILALANQRKERAKP